MEKKYLILLFWLSFANFLSAQIIRPGLISTQGTISVGKFLQNPASAFYLHGGLDAYLQKKVSFCGEIFWYLGETDEKRRFDYHHSLFWGLKYHFVKDNHDLEIGLLPGISVTKMNQNQIMIVSENQNHIGINPQASLILGYNYFVHRFFHIFAQARCLAGTHNKDIKTPLTEFRFSAGLGFNLNILKSK